MGRCFIGGKFGFESESICKSLQPLQFEVICPHRKGFRKFFFSTVGKSNPVKIIHPNLGPQVRPFVTIPDKSAGSKISKCPANSALVLNQNPQLIKIGRKAGFHKITLLSRICDRQRFRRTGRFYGEPGRGLFCRPRIKLGALNGNIIRNSPEPDPVIVIIKPRNNSDFGIRSHLKNPLGPSQANPPGQCHPAAAYHRHRQFVDNFSENVFYNNQAHRNFYFFRNLLDFPVFFYRDLFFNGDRTFFPRSRNR